MKKLIIVLLALLFFASICQAEWEVTVSAWEMSPGPNLAYEEIEVDGLKVEACGQIKPEDNKSCVFNLDTRDGQVISIKSYDTENNYVEYIIGDIGISPNPASGGSITVIWK